MSDFDTRRIGEIAVLEEKIRQMQAQLAEYKQRADLWTPVVSTKTDIGTGVSTISMMFGGKAFSATVSSQWLMDMDLTSGTTAILETLYTTHIADRLRPFVEHEVQRLKQNSTAVQGAGKW